MTNLEGLDFERTVLQTKLKIIGVTSFRAKVSIQRALRVLKMTSRQ